MNEQLLDRYSILSFEIKKLEAERDALKPEVLKMVEDSGEKTLKLSFGTFSLRKMKAWTYSDNVVAKLDEVKQLKKLEEEDGTAKAVESTTLQFKGNE